jgi:DNA modification methylase
VAATSDLWALGRHRLLCGDATKPDDVKNVLDGAKPHLMVTDPPYGVDYDPNWRNEEAAKGNLAYAAMRVGIVTNDARGDWSEAWALFTGDVAYCWHAGRFASTVQASLESTGLMIRSQIIWAKSNYPISRGHYHWRHEPCWYAVRNGKSGHWQGRRDQTTLWPINLDRNVEGGHSTQKPIECMKRPIENNSEPGDSIYEPFNGSGTTIIAAEMTARKCYAIEINPAYVDVAIIRWQNFTGKDATLGDETFAQVAGKRKSKAA